MSKFHFLKKSSFIIVVMIVCLLAATCVVIASTSNSGVAYADNNYDLWIADVQVTSTNSSGAGWSYEPSTNTLSLNNYVFYNTSVGVEHYAPIYYAGSADFTIDYTGTNNYIQPYKNSSGNIAVGIFSAANLTIKSSDLGYLQIRVLDSNAAYLYGIQCQGKLTIESGQLNIYTGYSTSQTIGIYCQNSGGFEFNSNYLRVEPISSFEINEYAIYNEGSAVIQSGTVILTSQSTSANAYAYYGPTSDTFLNVKSEVESFEAKSNGGVTGGNGGGIKNNISGYWYPATTGTDGKTDIAKSDTPQTYPSAKRITFSTPYMSVDTDQPEIFYDGQTHSPIITVSKPTAGYTIKWGTEYGVYNLDTAPSYTNAGEYYVYYKITADGYMSDDGYIDFVIQKGEWEVYTIPTVKENLKYTGEPIELVNPGSAEDTMVYTLLDCNWNYVQPYCNSEEIPKATAVGSYWFFYDVDEDENHELYEGNFEIIIAKGDIVLDVEPTPIDNLVYSGQAQQLIHSGSLQGKTVYYKLGASGEYSENIPTATEVGIYTIYYKVDGDENYEQYENHCEATIAKADIVLDVEPTPIDNLVYSGQAQQLIHPGSLQGKTVYYKLGASGEYSENTPTATGVGIYTIYYKVDGDENYNDFESHLDAEIARQYSFDSFVWADDYSSAQAKLVALDDGSDVKLVPATVISQVVEAPTCEHKGTTRYTATYSTEEESREVEDVDALGHTLVHHTAVAATIEAEGNIEYWTCSECDKYFSDSQGLREITQQDIVIAKLKREIQDPTSSVSIEINGDDSDRGFAENVNLKVEVKTNLSIKEGTTDYSSIQNFLSDNEKIAGVYDVKLILTVNGVETEIQPSDIKEGTTITVKMDIPNDVNSTDFRLLHIHSVNDMEFINNYTVENDAISFTINRLSEFAFIVNSSSQNVSDGAGFPSWAIALIVIGGVLVLGCICFLLLFFVLNKWIRKDDKAVRAFKIGKKDDEIKLMLMNFSIEYRVKEEIFDSKKEAEEEENITIKK